MMFDVDTIAQYLDVPVATIMAWARLGTIPTVRLGSRVLFRRSAIDAWLSDRPPRAVAAVRVPRLSRPVPHRGLSRAIGLSRSAVARPTLGTAC